MVRVPLRNIYFCKVGTFEFLVIFAILAIFCKVGTFNRSFWNADGHQTIKMAWNI